MSDRDPDEVVEPGELQALIRAYIACRVAVDSLPDLPPEVRERVEEPLSKFCHVVGPELERVNPGFFDRAEGR